MRSLVSYSRGGLRMIYSGGPCVVFLKFVNGDEKIHIFSPFQQSSEERYTQLRTFEIPNPK